MEPPTRWRPQQPHNPRTPPHEFADLHDVVALVEGRTVIGAQVIALRWLAGLLLASVLCNALLIGYAANRRDKARTATQELTRAQDDARACSDATKALQELAAKRAKEAAPARAVAAKAARTHTQRADKTLSAAPKVPGDMCASMQALGDDWLRGRQ